MPMTFADKYMANGATVLSALPSDAERRAELTKKIKQWEDRYQHFQQLVASGVDPGDMTAWDFVDVIDALQKELAKYGEHPAVANYRLFESAIHKGRP